jgi:hypothetical protein
MRPLPLYIDGPSLSRLKGSVERGRMEGVVRLTGNHTVRDPTRSSERGHRQSDREKSEESGNGSLNEHFKVFVFYCLFVFAAV